MIIAKYKVYYEYNGPTKCDPFRRELREDDIRYKLGRFRDEARTILWLDEKAPKVEVQEENLGEHYVIVSVRSPIDDERYDECLKKALNGLDLFAEELERTLE